MPIQIRFFIFSMFNIAFWNHSLQKLAYPTTFPYFSTNSESNLKNGYFINWNTLCLQYGTFCLLQTNVFCFHQMYKVKTHKANTITANIFDVITLTIEIECEKNRNFIKCTPYLHVCRYVLKLDKKSFRSPTCPICPKLLSHENLITIKMSNQKIQTLLLDKNNFCGTSGRVNCALFLAHVTFLLNSCNFQFNEWMSSLRLSLHM